jgi:hypothetical protein
MERYYYINELEIELEPVHDLLSRRARNAK